MKIYFYSAIFGTVCFLLAAVAAPQLASLPSPAPGSPGSPEAPAPEAPDPPQVPGPQPSPPESKTPSNADMIQHLMNDEALERKMSEREADNPVDPKKSSKAPPKSRLDSDYELGKQK